MSNTVCLEKTDIGATLTTWVYCALWQMYAAEKIGLRSYINWPHHPMRALRPCYDDAKFAEIPNMYDWYFEQPMVAREDADFARIWTWETPPPDLAKAQGDYCLYGPVSQIKEFYKKYLRFNPVVNGRGETFAKKYSIDFDKTIGVTWRGTDSVIDGRPRMPIETYFPFIDDILEKDSTLRIMCTAEEDILYPLLQRYPNAFRIEEFFTTPVGRNQLGDNPERFHPEIPGFERGMQPALIVWLFSKCKYLVKNRSSVSAVASWLSSGKIICLAHPENMGHGWDITKAEIEGKAVPLNR